MSFDEKVTYEIGEYVPKKRCCHCHHHHCHCCCCHGGLKFRQDNYVLENSANSTNMSMNGYRSFSSNPNQQNFEINDQNFQQENYVPYNQENDPNNLYNNYQQEKEDLAGKIQMGEREIQALREANEKLNGDLVNLTNVKNSADAYIKELEKENQRLKKESFANPKGPLTGKEGDDRLQNKKLRDMIETAFRVFKVISNIMNTPESNLKGGVDFYYDNPTEYNTLIQRYINFLLRGSLANSATGKDFNKNVFSSSNGPEPFKDTFKGTGSFNSETFENKEPKSNFDAVNAQVNKIYNDNNVLLEDNSNQKFGQAPSIAGKNKEHFLSYYPVNNEIDTNVPQQIPLEKSNGFRAKNADIPETNKEIKPGYRPNKNIPVLHKERAASPNENLANLQRKINNLNKKIEYYGNANNTQLRPKNSRSKEKTYVQTSSSIPDFAGTCFACEVGCNVSNTGYSPMTFSPYGGKYRRRSVTPLKPHPSTKQHGTMKLVHH